MASSWSWSSSSHQGLHELLLAVVSFTHRFKTTVFMKEDVEMDTDDKIASEAHGAT